MSRRPFSDAPEGGENLGEESSKEDCEESSRETGSESSRETGSESSRETGSESSRETGSEAGKKGSKEDCKEEEMLMQQGNGPSPVSSVHFFPAVILWWNLGRCISVLSDRDTSAFFCTASAPGQSLSGALFTSTCPNAPRGRSRSKVS